jgi:hypothetical protein
MVMASNSFKMLAVVIKDIGKMISSMAMAGKSGHLEPGMKVNTKKVRDMVKVCTIMLMVLNIEAVLRIANLMEKALYYGLMAPSTVVSSR